jgi:hypothetical protein
MPQRGNDLQPRVAASATLGKEISCPQPQRGCVCLVHFFGENNATALWLKFLFLLVSQGSRGGNPGLEAVVPLGHH